MMIFIISSPEKGLDLSCLLGAYGPSGHGMHGPWHGRAMAWLSSRSSRGSSSSSSNSNSSSSSSSSQIIMILK